MVLCRRTAEFFSNGECKIQITTQQMIQVVGSQKQTAR